MLIGLSQLAGWLGMAPIASLSLADIRRSDTQRKGAISPCTVSTGTVHNSMPLRLARRFETSRIACPMVAL